MNENLLNKLKDSSLKRYVPLLYKIVYENNCVIIFLNNNYFLQ